MTHHLKKQSEFRPKIVLTKVGDVGILSKKEEID